jgi:CubicO group peptidase (beta-lactamase class C family)
MRRVCYLIILCSAVLVGCDKVSIVKNPGEAQASSQKNVAPVVNAGDDLTVQWPQDSVQLTATATDDGLPSNTLTYSWQSVMGEVQFDTATASETVVHFSQPGTYRVRVVANDGALGGEDFVLIEVLPASPSSNTAPTVDAGADQSIELPLAASLQGSASDDGVPGAALAIAWSVQSGPGTVSFENASSAATKASFTAPGNYELLLSVNDGELTSTDTIAITVAPAVYPAPDLSDDDPNRGWLRVAPADVGMTASGLSAAQAYAEAAGGSGLISRHGRLVHSWGGIDLPRYELKSTTASIGAIALALAIDDGKAALTDKAATHLPTFGNSPIDNKPGNDPAQLQYITLLQLATHTAGFEKTGDYGKLLDAPGTTWRYSDGGLNWLADVLTAIYRQDLEQVFVSRVWPVLGIREGDDIQWRESTSGMRRYPRPDGIEHREFAAGMIANVNALARVGLLYLRRGEWSGGKRVFSASFSDLVRTPQPEVAATTLAEPMDFPDANHRYGVLWWTNATGALPNVPRDAYWAWGLGDSLIVVIPSLDLVIARAGKVQTVPSPGRRIFGDDDWNADYSVLAPFLDPIVASVTQ